MTYVGIDTSLTSTGLFIKADNAEHYYNYRNSTKMTKWHRVASYVTYRDYEVPEMENFSDEQLAKLIKYDQITDMIVNDILAHCKPEETQIFTESYSYSSMAGPLIDLVTYATLLRIKLVKHNFNNIVIIPPTSLKSKTCVKVYGPGDKKKPSRNHIGISGGKFKKPDMLRALFESEIVNQLKSSLEYHKEEMLQMKSVPAPIGDLIDAIWLVNSNI